jgi:hypothetical protein
VIEQSDHVLTHRVVAVGGGIVRSRRATVTARVGGDYAPTCGNESCDDASRNPVATVVRGEAVQEHDDPSSTFVEKRYVRSVE